MEDVVHHFERVAGLQGYCVIARSYVVFAGTPDERYAPHRHGFQAHQTKWLQPAVGEHNIRRMEKSTTLRLRKASLKDYHVGSQSGTYCIRQRLHIVANPSDGSYPKPLSLSPGENLVLVTLNAPTGQEQRP